MTRTLNRSAALALAGLLAMAPHVGAQPYRAAPVHIDRATIRAPANGAVTASGYVTIENRGPGPDRLLGAVSPCCERIELHWMSMAGGMMSMRPVAFGLEIAPGRTLDLSPGGPYHLMLIRPRRPLRAGDHVGVTLRFQHAGEQRADFLVR